MSNFDFDAQEAYKVLEEMQQQIVSRSDEVLHKRVTNSQSEYDITKRQIEEAKKREYQVNELARLVNADSKAFYDYLNKQNSINKEGKVFFANYTKQPTFRKGNLFEEDPAELQKLSRRFFEGKNLTKGESNKVLSFLKSQQPLINETDLRKAGIQSITEETVKGAVAASGGRGGNNINPPPIATGGFGGLGGSGSIDHLLDHLIHKKTGLPGLGMLNRFIGGGFSAASLFRGFAAYETLTRLSHEIANVRGIGGLTGEGVGAGASARFEATKYHLMHPFQVVGGREALEIMKTVRGAGFRGSEANAGLSSIADTANKLNVSSEAFRDLAITFVRSVNPRNTKETINAFKEFEASMTNLGEVAKTTGNSLSSTIANIKNATTAAAEEGGASATKRSAAVAKAFQESFPSFKDVEGEKGKLTESIEKSPLAKLFVFLGGGDPSLPPDSQQEELYKGAGMWIRSRRKAVASYPKALRGARAKQFYGFSLPGVRATQWEELFSDVEHPPPSSYEQNLTKEKTTTVSNTGKLQKEYGQTKSLADFLDFNKYGSIKEAYTKSAISTHPLEEYRMKHLDLTGKRLYSSYDKYINEMVKKELSGSLKTQVKSYEDFMVGSAKEQFPKASSTEINRRVGEAMLLQPNGQQTVKVIIELDPAAARFFKKNPKAVQQSLNNLNAAYGDNPNTNRHGSRVSQ